jgi:hypothetical protein
MKYKSFVTKLNLWFVAITVITVLFLLSSCPPQIDDDLLKQVKDELGPTIKINSPEDGDSYAATVVVSGNVEDATTDEGDTGEVESLAFEVKATGIGDAVSFNDKGKFSFSFETKGLSGSLTVTVTAEDKNGNSTEASITLEDAGAIPSFSAKPGNHKVKLSWDDVPMAESYTLYYTTNGTMPSENYGSKIDNVTTPYSMSSLENGELHVFKLKANSSEGADNWSHVEYAIPLSERTLAPRVYEEYGQIELVWNAIPATDEYEVYRSTSSKGSYINISGTINATSFTDTTVEDNQNYFYKIKPALSGSSLSAAGFGRADPFRSDYPHQIAGCDTPSYAGKIKLYGSHAYIADQGSGLQVLDISDPRNPYISDYTTTFNTCVDVDVTTVGASLFAYTATRSNGVSFINVTNPSNITYINKATYPFGEDSAIGIDADNGYIYVADMLNGLEIFSINPNNSGYITYQSNYQSGGATQAWDVSVTGNNACVAYSNSSMVVVDVSNPSSPSSTKSYSTVDSIQAVAASGNYAYIVDDGEFISIDITLGSLTIYGSCPLNTTAEDITISGNYAYVTGEEIYIVDISDAAAPSVIGHQNTSGDSAGIDADGSGQYAYVADGYAGMKVFDLFKPDSPALGTVVSTANTAKDAAVYGNYLYAAVHTDGMQAFTLTNPSSPVLKDSIETDDSANEIAICGDFAFIADSTAGLQIIDISEPANMERVSTCDTPYSAQDIVLKGDYALIADYSSGIQIIDISDISTPELISSYNTPGYAWGVDVSGDYAFVADDSEGLRILDISNPNLPGLIGSVAAPGANLRALSVAVRGNYAYVGYRSSSGSTDPVLQTVDISNPSSPVETATATTTEDVYSVTVRGIYIYLVSTDTGGIEIFSLGTPSSPTRIANLPTPNSAQGLAVNGGYTYIADGTAGLQVVELDP